MSVIPKGTAVVKTPCPRGCSCDGRQVQIGSPGIVTAGPRQMDGPFGTEEYYTVKWERMLGGASREWGTYRHGLEVVSVVSAAFPDMFYIEG